MFPTCHGRNLLNKDDTAPLRRPRKAEAASTKKPNSTNCPVPGKFEDLPSSNARKTEGSSVYIARNLDEVTLRRPRAASIKNRDDITCPVPQKTEDVPACTLRNTEGGSVHVGRTLEEVTLRRPRKAEAVSSLTKTANDTTCLVPQKREDVPTSNVWKTENASVCEVRKAEEVSSAPVSTKTNAVSSPPHVPSLPLCAAVSGPDHATLLALRELLSRVQYSADDEEAQEHIHNLYRHLKVYGKMLDGSCKGEMDSVFVVLRDLGRDSGLAYLSRLLLLELIELRAARWDASPHLHSYYSGKLEKFPEIKMLTPSNAPSAVASVLSCLTTPKGFSPRGPVVEDEKEETKRRTCQETITVCESLAAKVFESTEKIRRLEQRCRADLECYPDAEGEDCLVRITAENQDVINHAVGVIEEAIAEVELQERQRRRPPQADVWHRPRGRDMESADSWGTLQYSSYQDKIAARARYNGGTQMGNGTQVSPASHEEKSPYQKPVREETTTTLVCSSRQHQNIIPARPVPEPVPVITPTVTHVQDDLDWDDVDDNSELFVWKAHTTLASEVNRLAAVKEPNVGFDHQQEVPCGKIKTKKTKQNAPSPTEKQNSSSCSTVAHEGRISPNISKNNYDNTMMNTYKLDDVNSFSGGTVPIPEAVVQTSKTSQTLKEKANGEVVHKDRTPSSETNNSYVNSADSQNSFRGQQGDTSQPTTPLSNGVKDKDAEKKTIETMWAGWVDENTRSPMELSETAFFPEHVPSVDGDVQNRHTASTEHDPSPLSDSSVASLAEMMMMMSLAEKDQEGISEHTASSAEDWNEDDIYYSDEDDLLDALCENCCPSAGLAASPESPDVIAEKEFYSPRSSHTGLVTIREEKDEGAEDNNNSSNCEDTVNNNNNNNNKTVEAEPVQDICSCSTVVDDGVDVNSRRSPVSLGIQGISEKAEVDVTSPSRIHEERQCVRSTEASNAEKPGSSRTLLGAFSATRPQFKLPRFLVNTIRQPLSPLYHQTVLDRSTDGCYGQAGNKHMGQRRFLFAKTAKLYYDHHPDQSEVQQEGPVQWEGPVKRYSRDVLLRLSHSPACSIKPSGLPPLPCVQ